MKTNVQLNKRISIKMNWKLIFAWCGFRNGLREWQWKEEMGGKIILSNFQVQ